MQHINKNNIENKNIWVKYLELNEIINNTETIIIRDIKNNNNSNINDINNNNIDNILGNINNKKIILL